MSQALQLLLQPRHECRHRGEQRHRIGLGCILQALDQGIGLRGQHRRSHRAQATGLAMQVQGGGNKFGSRDDRPPARREVYEKNGRRSAVLVKSLD